MKSKHTVIKKPELNASKVIGAIEAGPKDIHELAKLFKLGTRQNEMKPLVELVNRLIQTQVIRVFRNSEDDGAKMALFTPESLMALRRQEMTTKVKGAGANRVRLSLRLSDAYLLRDALESFSRVGIGQVETVVESVRFNSCGKDSVIDFDQLEELDRLSKSLKSELIGFASSSSYGIFNKNVPKVFKDAWAFYRHIRHRLAWDQTPTGGMGVHFDEVMDYDEEPLDVVVVSDVAEHLGTPAEVLRIEMAQSDLSTFVKALEFQSDMLIGNFAAVVDVLVNEQFPPSQGHPAIETRVAVAKEIAGEMQGLVPCSYTEDVRIVSEMTRMRSMAKLLQSAFEKERSSDCEMKDENALCVSVNPTSALEFKAIDLPPGLSVVGYARGGYGVLAPDDGQATRFLLASSGSLQTVMLMACNKIMGARARSADF